MRPRSVQLLLTAVQDQDEEGLPASRLQAAYRYARLWSVPLRAGVGRPPGKLAFEAGEQNGDALVEFLQPVIVGQCRRQ